ncbi:MAG: acyl-homoserine-lactone synthase [Bdellovibrionales bacterium]
MLYAINIENAHEYGDAMAQLYRLRFRQFKERQSYAVPVYKGMEYDQYDTLATVNLVWIDEDGIVRGSSRLNPTDRPYMLADLWPQMSDQPLPHDSRIWEGTRICIEKNLSGELRERIKWEIILGYLEFGLANGIEKYIGVMMNYIWRRVFIQSGWGADYLGEERLIDGLKTRAGQVFVSQEALYRVRQTTGITSPVLQNMLRVELDSETTEALAS